MIGSLLTPTNYARARSVLLRRDPVLAEIIKRQGPCGLGAVRDRFDHFSMLVRAITFQQLSTKAATTIHDRLLALLPDSRPTPVSLSAISDDQFRSAGVSRQKAAYLRDLCTKVGSGAVPLEDVDSMSDDEVIESLTKVKGIGRWTAEMFLIFRLQRPDVLPVDDLGIVTAMQKAYGLRKRPKPDRMRKIAEAWRPYRSVACWYLWRSLDNKLPKKP
jgi:DNA-3-methyladenine glycosylase II